MRALWFVAGINLLLPFFAADSFAAEIYQWRDKAGIVHFTDDPMQVPADQRSGATRKLEPLPLQHSSLGSSGKDVWDEKCALCHSSDALGREGKLGLGKIVWPPDALGPIGLKALIKTLRFAADGRYSDMGKVDTDDEELESIARHLLSVQK
ncbi:MAG: DUF4124 domain-containing protein [Mariprofundaceae bacterium]